MDLMKRRINYYTHQAGNDYFPLDFCYVFLLSLKGVCQLN
jgi:hypothetical protein